MTLPAGRPYWDELASSAILRCSRNFGISLKRLGTEICSRRGWRPSFTGAWPLDPLAGLFRLSRDELLWNHTSFPYATATLDGTAFQRALRNIAGSNAQQVGLGAITQNATCGLKERRFCQRCMEDELRHTGETFWHRAHNLPGVWVCTRHQTFLRKTEIRLDSKVQIVPLLPHETGSRPIASGDVPMALLSVAQTSVDWLKREWEPGQPPSTAFYRDLAEAAGWLDPGRQVDRFALHRLVLETFSLHYLRTASLPTTAATNEWPVLMLRPRTEVPFAPIKHAMLQALLGQSPSSTNKALHHVSSGPCGTDIAKIDSFYAAAAARALKRAQSTGDKLTTAQFLRSVGCLSAYRHHGDALPKLRQVVREFRGSAATVKRLRPDKSLFRKKAVVESGCTEVHSPDSD